MDSTTYQKVVEANIALHSKMSSEYNTCEPHFRPENTRAVEEKIMKLVEQTSAKKLLDLGCGTGFIIGIAKKYMQEINGVDVTRAMMDKVDTSGDCIIRLFEADTGSFDVSSGDYDIVTGYSFLHHLYDILPTIKTAYNALRQGGKFYADLDPNYYFWESIDRLDRAGTYDFIVKREIEAVSYKDEDIEQKFGVAKEVFNSAEYGKNIAGGFKAEEIEATLHEVGFRDVTIAYHWFIGQGSLINDVNYSVEDRFKYASVANELLQKALPLSRNLFKYISIIATK